MTPNTRRAWLVPWIGLWMGLFIGVMVVFLGISSTQSDAATLLEGSFRGNAYATFANAEAGPVATQLGRSAYQPCPCQGTGGKTLSNTVDSVQAGQDGKVLRANGTLSTVFTEKTATSARVKNTSKVSGLKALDPDGPGGSQDPLITAKAIKAVANTSATSSSMKSSPNGSEFVNLVIAGQEIAADVAPNTKVDLDGIGHVVLKSVKKGGNGESLSTITVDMLTIVVKEENEFGLPVGSRIVVAHAFSGFSRNEPEVIVGGKAYGAEALATTDELKNRVGKAAFITMGCEGTNGKTRTNNVNTLDVADILSAGTSKTTAFGGPTPSGTVAKTTATVEDLSLLEDEVGQPLITANLVKAVAKDTFKDGTRTSSTEGSGFVNLVIDTGIADVPIDANVPPNTEVPLDGIGFVVINEQIVPEPSSTARLQVNGLRIKVTKANTLGLPVGTQIVVAHADSTAVRFRA